MVELWQELTGRLTTLIQPIGLSLITSFPTTQPLVGQQSQAHLQSPCLNWISTTIDFPFQDPNSNLLVIGMMTTQVIVMAVGWYLKEVVAHMIVVEDATELVDFHQD